jgi:hypothetical protein
MLNKNSNIDMNLNSNRIHELDLIQSLIMRIRVQLTRLNIRDVTEKYSHGDTFR